MAFFSVKTLPVEASKSVDFTIRSRIYGHGKGRAKITADELKEVIIKRNKFHGEWNYEIHPNK